jgi:pimeloyl-ACP methyl ester carboxylesterase
VDRQRRARLSNDARELAASLRGLGPAAQPALFDELGQLNVPVLLVAGELDHAFVDAGRDLAGRMPAAETCEIAGAGHAVHLEQPEAFMRAAMDFLRRASIPAPTPDSYPDQETA